MGMRFRKSINFGGARINFSKSGIGASVGGKGFRYTKKAGGGTRTTASIPGTGLSYQKDSKKNAKSQATQGQVNSAVCAVPASPMFTFFWIMFTILAIPLLALGALLLLVEPAIGAASVALGIILLIVAKHYKKHSKKIGQSQTRDTSSIA